ncbi:MULTISPECIES: hypothetical protein [Moorena]|uniref:hypothetical protein n=1 Tax=Moorena TaxID=1155738 RepID=UPI001056C37D|nr:MULTISPECIES: hypothetical protein [Moorena]NEP65891.1 hypothetical protein [Moorena sp. SIO3A5]NER87381.1 hypothetical protein [Moorena sp. SIO3A2]
MAISPYSARYLRVPPLPDSRFPTPYSLLPTPYSRFPISDSRFPTPYSLLPVPCSLKQKYFNQLKRLSVEL